MIFWGGYDSQRKSDLVTFIKSSNEYYEVPYDVSSVFTGRKNILQNLHDAFVPRHEQVSERVQKRYVIYGLGGSGKTQICLKFAQDCREKYAHCHLSYNTVLTNIERRMHC